MAAALQAWQSVLSGHGAEVAAVVAFAPDGRGREAARVEEPSLQEGVRLATLSSLEVALRLEAEHQEAGGAFVARRLVKVLLDNLK